MKWKSTGTSAWISHQLLLIKRSNDLVLSGRGSFLAEPCVTYLPIYLVCILAKQTLKEEHGKRKMTICHEVS